MQPIAAIKAQLGVDAYASRFLKVKNRKAICPFHKEKTPSLSVYRDYFYCHACSTSGDLLKFAMLYHQVPLRQAIRILADETGVSLTPQPKPHPYDAARAERTRRECEEWREQLRINLRDAMLADDYDRISPFLESLESMSKTQLLTAYQEQKTPEQAAMLRSLAADRAKPTAEKLMVEFLQWSR